MQASVIKMKIANSADRYGYNNTQQIRQLLRTFSNHDPQQIFEGCISVFKESHPNSGDRQELSARLLFQLNPQAHFNLYTEIKDCLLHFDPSVEHLPFYFVKQCGLEEVSKTLEYFQSSSLCNQEKTSLNTMQFWLKNYDQWKKNNGCQ